MPGARVNVAGVIEADLTWTGARFERGIRVVVDADGRIVSAGATPAEPTERLSGRALVPGLVDVHSHAFQRGLRGRGERFPAGAGSFWTWRQAMYGLVDSLDGPAFHDLCLRAFEEMRDAGITTVGEFHYLHHGADGEEGAFDPLVLDAAAESGIRLVLLQTFYRTGGIGRPLADAQRRFGVSSTTEFWDRFDALGAAVHPSTQSLAVAAHSIRAASPDDIALLHAECGRRALPLHLHVEEQRAEIAESVSAYGAPPMAVLLGALPSTTGIVAVHCTHTRPADLAAFVDAGGMICVCPLTEANLGDGLPDLAPLGERPGRLCLGTDSNARISMLEEMRWLEYGQRLRREARGALAATDGTVARGLLAAGTSAGARALGVHSGAIEAGRWADFLALDLDAPELAGGDEDTLLEAWIFGAGDRTVAASCVGGRWRESGRPR